MIKTGDKIMFKTSLSVALLIALILTGLIFATAPEVAVAQVDSDQAFARLKAKNAPGNVVIGDDVSIGPNCTITTNVPSNRTLFVPPPRAMPKAGSPPNVQRTVRP